MLLGLHHLPRLLQLHLQGFLLAYNRLQLLLQSVELGEVLVEGPSKLYFLLHKAGLGFSKLHLLPLKAGLGLSKLHLLFLKASLGLSQLLGDGCL